jgi:Domain of unknown function (DUF6484)
MTQPLRRHPSIVQSAGNPVVGTLVRLSADGLPFVEFPGSHGEVQARTTVAEPAPANWLDSCGRAVLLVFDEGDEQRPVIVGFVRDSLWQASAPRMVPDVPAETSTPAQRIHAASVVIEGEREIVLRCGEGSIALTADGRIVIKGTRLTSRASETNKVRGAVVLIN